MSAFKPTDFALNSADFSPLETSAENSPILSGDKISEKPMEKPATKIRAQKQKNDKVCSKEVRFAKVVNATEIQSRKDQRRRNAGAPITEEICSGNKLKLRLAKPSNRSHPYGPPVDCGVPGVTKEDIIMADRLYANMSLSSENNTIRSTDGETTVPQLLFTGPLSILKPSTLNSRNRRSARINEKSQEERATTKFVTTRKRQGRKDESILVNDNHLKKRKVSHSVDDVVNIASDEVVGRKNPRKISTMENAPDHGKQMDEEPVRIEDPAMEVVPVSVRDPDEPAVIFMDDDTAPANDVLVSTHSRKTNGRAHGGKKRQSGHNTLISATSEAQVSASLLALGSDAGNGINAKTKGTKASKKYKKSQKDRKDKDMSIVILDDTEEGIETDITSENPQDIVYGPHFKHSIDISQGNWSPAHQMVVQGLLDDADFACLRKGARDERLTDNCVYFGLLQAASVANSNGHNVSVFAPQLFTQWRRNQQQPNGNIGFTREQILDFAYVKEQQAGRQLEDFLMPLHKDNGKNTASADAHWSLAFFDAKKCSVVVYDSLKSTKQSTKEQTIKDIKGIMEKLVSPEAYRRLKVRYCFSNHVEYQQGGISCGIHTIVNARRLMEGRRSLVNKTGEKINQRNERDYLHEVLKTVKRDLDEAVFVFAMNPVNAPPHIPAPSQPLNQRSRRDHTETIRKIRRCIEYYRKRR